MNQFTPPGFADHPVHIVSGIPRSGTSLVMQMLKAGGADVVCDDTRGPDCHNPYGYFEHRKTKSGEIDADWIAGLAGRVLKVVSTRLPALPASSTYRIIYVLRDYDEVARSQLTMIDGSGSFPLRGLETALRSHAKEILLWLRDRENISFMLTHYTQLLRDPCGESEIMRRFSGLGIKPQYMRLAVRSKNPTNAR